MKASFPKAKSYTDRHGVKRWRFYEKGHRVELGAKWGSEEFSRRYAEAEGKRPEIGANLTTPKTINDLAVRFYRLHFPTLEESTRNDYRAVIDALREKHGNKRVAHLKRRHVTEIKSDMADTPQQANKTLKRLSQMMDLAMELEWRTDNPVKGVKRFPTSPEGFHTWDEGEIAQFYATHEIGTPAYLAMTLMLYTGAAKCDVVRMGKANLKEGRIIYRRNKTKKNPNGIEVNIPIHPNLAEALAFVPDGAFTILQTERGKSRTAAGLGSSMRKWCDKAELPLCSSHGLRKAICRRIAEGGGTAFEIMSVSGHISLKEAQGYCEKFGRKNLADSAMSKLPGGSNGEQNLVNHPQRFTKKPTNHLKTKEK